MSDLARVVRSVMIGLAVTGLILATQLPFGDSQRVPTFSHEQLEADRVMTLQMATGADPAMDSSMQTSGMLARSQSSAYVAALEQHTRIYNKMAGLTP